MARVLAHGHDGLHGDDGRREVQREAAWGGTPHSWMVKKREFPIVNHPFMGFSMK